jgi:hypothetical protein
MRRLFVAGLVVLSAVAAIFPATIQLSVTKKVILKGELEDLVTFGLLKEMTCDSEGNIFSPSNRKYGSAINAIVRFTRDATSYMKFSVDSLNDLEDGTIIDFDLEPNGDLYVLARQVLKYSDVEVPIEFGENFIVHFDSRGKLISQLRLKLETTDFAPTGLAVLKDNEYLVVGRRRSEGETFVVTQLFRFDGNLKAKVELNQGRTAASNEKTAGSERGFNPIAIKANGLIYVMRRTTAEPVYVLSETGQLLKSIQLRPSGVEFGSPKIVGNNLIVGEHPQISDEETDGAIRRGPRRMNFPIFNLETGDKVDEYYWHEEFLQLACYTPGLLTFIGQDVSKFPGEWAIFEAKPAVSTKAKTAAAGQ